MDLKEQFNYEDFCLRFARFLFPHIGADEIIAKGEFVTKLYRKCIKLYFIPEEKLAGSKADICFRIGCEFSSSYTLYGETFKQDVAGAPNVYPAWCTDPFKIVVRKDVKLGELEVIKHMKHTFNANVLYLMRYSGRYSEQAAVNRLRNALYNEKIYLVFYHEINTAKSLAEDFGVLL